MIGSALALAVVFAQVAPVAPPVAVPAQSALEGIAAEATVVAGNVTSARKRALDEALFQSVDLAFTALAVEMGLDLNALPVELSAFRASLRADARALVRSYRVLSEAESAGRFRIVIDAVIHTGLLRQKIVSVRPSAAATAAVSGLWLLSDSAFAMPLVAAALARAGIIIGGTQSGGQDASMLRKTEARARDATIITVSSRVLGQDRIRGADQIAVTCDVSLVANRDERNVAREQSGDRGFAADAEGARTACLEQASASAVARLLPILTSSNQVEVGRVVFLDVVTDQPAALERVVLRLARMGSIARSEPRRIVVGSAEIRLVTTLSPSELLAALQNELGTAVQIDKLEAMGDRLRLQVVLPGQTPAATPVVP
ncbi:MAG: hypothetical protein SGI86_13885 [Deltaproteobacteria bacterium]|nr:hypothetical protein [Deltaproteobacteria bacterium]